jgi:hypothetical protein
MKIDKDFITVVCGVLNLSYMVHLIRVCLRECLKGDGLAYNGGVSVVGSCMVGQFIAFVSILVILCIAVWNLLKNRKRS